MGGSLVNPYVYSVGSGGGGGGGYVSVVSTSNLYTHYDFSLTTEAAGTIISTPSTYLSSAMTGTNWGAGTSTPAISYTASVATTYPMQIKQTLGGLKYISFTTNNGGAGIGSKLISNGNAFPDITSSGYSWFAVYRMTGTPNGYTRSYRWFLNGYSYDYNHGTWWDNVSGNAGEMDIINYAASSAAVSDALIASTKGVITTTNIYAVFVSVVGTAVTACYINSSAGATILPLITSALAAYSTQPQSNRYLEIRDYAYSTIATTVDMMEIGFYSAPVSTSIMTSNLLALYNKWSATYTSSLVASPSSVNEGSSVTVTVTSNAPSGTVFTYTISGTGITASRISGGLTGNFSAISGGQATAVISVNNDYITNGSTTAIISIAGASTSFTINDTSVTPTYFVSAPTSVNEGTTAIFTVTALTGAPNGLTATYALSGTALGVPANYSRITGTAWSGVLTMNSNAATLNVPISADYITEGSTTLTLTLTNSGAGSVNTSTTVNDTYPTPTYFISAPTSVNEGTTATFTVTALAGNPPNGLTATYALSGTALGNINNPARITGTAWTGILTMNSNAATLNVPISADYITEGSTTLTMSLTNAGATSVNTSTTVNDTYVAPTYFISGTTSTTFSATATYSITALTGNPPNGFTATWTAAGVNSYTLPFSPTSGILTFTNNTSTLSLALSSFATTGTYTVSVRSISSTTATTSTSVVGTTASGVPLVITLTGGRGGTSLGTVQNNYGVGGSIQISVSSAVLKGLGMTQLNYSVGGVGGNAVNAGYSGVRGGGGGGGGTFVQGNNGTWVVVAGGGGGGGAGNTGNTNLPGLAGGTYTVYSPTAGAGGIGGTSYSGGYAQSQSGTTSSGGATTTVTADGNAGGGGGGYGALNIPGGYNSTTGPSDFGGPGGWGGGGQGGDGGAGGQLYRGDAPGGGGGGYIGGNGGVVDGVANKNAGGGANYAYSAAWVVSSTTGSYTNGSITITAGGITVVNQATTGTGVYVLP
jgi:hypothetical protein